jgi:hypothetical protein
MSSSVAGQIRIDLIAQAAQFNAGLREGKQSLGSFQEQFEKLNRSFGSQKNIAARIGAEKDAWGAAMKGLRGEISAGGNSMLPWYSLERMNARGNRAEDNRIRWKSMIPWGNTLRTELSREAAETAALIGSKKQTILRELAGAGQSLAYGVPGIGGVLGRGVGLLANPTGLAVGATVGIGAKLLAETIATARERDRHIREIDIASKQMGQSAGDTSLLLGAGFEADKLSKFQRALSEQKEGFLKLGLDPESLGTKPLKDSLLQVADALENRVKNSADRTRIAMELFGRSGASLMDTLEEMKVNMSLVGAHEIVSAQDIERVKMYEHSVKAWENSKQKAFLDAGRAFGSESGLGTAVNFGLAWLGSDQAGRRELEQLREADNYRIQHAAEVEAVRVKQEALNAATEKYNTALAGADKTIQGINDKADRIKLGDAGFEREKFSKGLMAELGVKRDEWGFLRGDKQNQEVYRDKMAKYDFAVDRERSLRQNQEAKEMAKKEAEERKKEQDRLIDEEDAAFEKLLDEERDLKKSLRSPEDIARDSLAELSGKKDVLTDEEYHRGRGRIAETLAGAMGGGEIRTVGMMEAGSAELHSLVAKANMPDPKEALAKQTLAVLERIERELAEQRGEVLQ